MIKTARIVIYTIMLFIGFSASFSSYLSAQQLDSEQVKVAYLFNFLKHIRWPNHNQKSNLVIAVYDDTNFLKLLKDSMGNRAVAGKSISIIGVNSNSAARKADLLYIPFQHIARVPQIASSLRRTATLLVTDRSVNKNDVMINLVFNEKTSAISFEVNKSNIVYEELEMSAELLLLGGTELDVATLYRETELAMQKIKAREVELTKKLSGQEQRLVESSQKLTAMNKELQRSTKEINKQKSALETLENNVKLQREALESKERQLSMVASLLDEAESTLVNQQTAVAAQEIENQKMAQKVVENKEILQQQTESLQQQKLQLAQQNEELFQRKEKISSQQTTIFVTSILIVVAVVFLMLVIALFVKNRRTTSKLSQTLSDLETTQGQLIQSEKMASLGTLTAGVAHEINTPLGIIVTSISLTRESTNEIRKSFERGALKKSTMSNYFDAVEKSSDMSTKALDRVVTLLNNFKQVAADQVVGDARKLNIAHYIEEVMDTLSAEIKRKHIDYQYIGQPKIVITTIPGIFAQILTNLVTNAISHGFENRQNGVIKIHVNQLQDGGVDIRFSDDGCGMTQEVIDKIFDPFFTTKRNHGGTGLGMNIVYNLITNKLQGDIHISSVVGEGTVITIKLPKSVLT